MNPRSIRTVGDLRRLTADLSDDTPIHILNDFGEFAPALSVSIDDLTPSDPARESFPRASFVIAFEPLSDALA